MMNDHAQQTVAASVCGPGGCFRRPLYESYCFARLSATLEYLLTGDEAARAAGLPADALGPLDRPWQTVIVVLVDGFGWHLFGQYAPRLPFLRRFLDAGVVSPLTAQFPSTTAAHMTTLHTGLPVGQHGVLEWFYYEPVLDAVFAPLLFSLAGEGLREALAQRKVDPESVYPPPRWYRRLAERGVACTVFQDEKYADSSYSTTMFAGARRCGYDSLTGGLARLVEEVRGSSGRRYFFFYLDAIDARGHGQGLDTPDFEGQVMSTFGKLEEGLYQALAGQAGDTLLVMSADHGLVPVNQFLPVYVNLALPGLSQLLRTNRAGEVIPFGGSGRDLFLYARPGCLGELEGQLTSLLTGRAEVWRTEWMLKEGFFGPPPHDRLLPRLGDLVVLPQPGLAVFWYEEGRFRVKHQSSHGGLTPQEMDTGVYLLPI